MSSCTLPFIARQTHSRTKTDHCSSLTLLSHRTYVQLSRARGCYTSLTSRFPLPKAGKGSSTSKDALLRSNRNKLKCISRPKQNPNLETNKESGVQAVSADALHCHRCKWVRMNKLIYLSIQKGTANMQNIEEEKVKKKMIVEDVM